jgi:hypothetical protein
MKREVIASVGFASLNAAKRRCALVERRIRRMLLPRIFEKSVAVRHGK